MNTSGDTRSTDGSGADPGPVRAGDRVEGIAIGWAHSLRSARQHLPLVIAANGGQVERHQALGRLGREQRAGEYVAQIDREIDVAALDVGQDGIEREQVAVDVGYCSDSHLAGQCTSSGGAR